MRNAMTSGDFLANTSRIIEKTVNLAQAANTYDLLTATGDILIDAFTMYVTTVGATFTSVSIQTNDTTPYVLLTAAEGAVVNILAQKNIQSAVFDKTFRLTSGKKIQYTIVGSTGTGEIKVAFRWRPISTSATVA